MANEYALIEDGKIVNIIVADEEFAAALAGKYESVIRIDELETKPPLTATYDGKDFIDPSKPVPKEGLELLEEKASEYMSFGSELYDRIGKKVWATNAAAELAGSPLTKDQILALLLASRDVETTLKSGSLRSAKEVLMELKVTLPQYTEMADLAIAEIDAFMGV